MSKSTELTQEQIATVTFIEVVAVPTLKPIRYVTCGKVGASKVDNINRTANGVTFTFSDVKFEVPYSNISAITLK